MKPGVGFKFVSLGNTEKIMHNQSKTLRVVTAVVLAAVSWLLVLNSLMFLLQSLWPAYTIAHPERAYSLLMLLARLAIFAVTIAVASIVATLVSQQSWMPLLAGIVMLAASIPDHLYPGYVWNDFPAWYHLVYLVYIVPISWISGSVVFARNDVPNGAK